MRHWELRNVRQGRSRVYVTSVSGGAIAGSGKKLFLDLFVCCDCGFGVMVLGGFHATNF